MGLAGVGWGSFRVSRGGGWILGAGFCRAPFRDFALPGGRSHYLGFRLLRTE